MGDRYPITHVKTREQTIDEVRRFIVIELGEIDRAIEIVAANGGHSIELVAERNALARVLKFLSNMEMNQSDLRQ